MRRFQVLLDISGTVHNVNMHNECSDDVGMVFAHEPLLLLCLLSDIQ